MNEARNEGMNHKINRVEEESLYYRQNINSYLKTQKLLRDRRLRFLRASQKFPCRRCISAPPQRKEKKKLGGANSSSSSSSRASDFFLFHNGLKDAQKKLPQTKKETNFSLDNQNFKLQTEAEEEEEEEEEMQEYKKIKKQNLELEINKNKIYETQTREKKKKTKNQRSK
jgi:hypothetical protein